MDNLESHRAFAKNHQLTFPLISDADNQIGSQYGVKNRGGYFERVTFIIGADGNIAKVFPKVNPRGHADEVLVALRSLSSK